MTMDLMWLLLFLSCTVYADNTVKEQTYRVTKETDFCQFEMFNPRCHSDEILVMEKALYGRMKLNRCVTNDYGYLGCQTNVFDVLNGICSGGRDCSFNVPDLRMKANVSPCPKDLVVYLSAKYSCIKVANAQRCNNAKTIKLTSTSGYISSYYAFQNGTGSHRCPILIESSPGQKINISLHNYVDDNVSGDGCPHHIIVKDGDYVEKMELCSKRDMGLPVVYTSVSPSLRLFFSGRTGSDNRHLIHYKVLGCKAMIPPGEATFKLTGEGRGAVRCGQTVWFVTCIGNKWTGKVGNCSKAITGLSVHGNKDRPQDPSDKDKKSTYPIGLVLAVGIGLILGLLFGSALLIIVLMHRKKRRRSVVRTQKSNTLLGGESSNYETEEHYYRHPCQANNCDGRCVAPSTYCGQSRIYNPMTHNYVQNVELMQSSPCQAHTLYAKRPLPPTYNTNTTPRSNKQTNTKFASILSKPSAKQSTTFSTFRPPNSETDSLYDRFSTYQTRRGIIKMPADNSGVCTCDSNEQTTPEPPKPDVVQSNHTPADDTGSTDTSTQKKPQVILLPKTNNTHST